MKISTAHFLKRGLVLLTGALFSLPYLATSKAQQTPSAGFSKESVEFFEQKIRPVLINQCYQCHSTQGHGAQAKHRRANCGSTRARECSRAGLQANPLGFDHARLTYRHGGRDYRLTDVHGNIVKGILV